MSRVRRRRLNQLTASTPAQPAPMTEREEAVRAVLARWGRSEAPDQVRFCSPSRAEKAGLIHSLAGSDGKVIFDDEANALGASGELYRIAGWMQVPYRCPRMKAGHRGHWHLTSDLSSSHVTSSSRAPLPDVESDVEAACVGANR